MKTSMNSTFNTQTQGNNDSIDLAFTILIMTGVGIFLLSYIAL